MHKLTQEEINTLTDVTERYEKVTHGLDLGSWYKIWNGRAIINGERWACFSTDNKTWWASYSLAFLEG